MSLLMHIMGTAAAQPDTPSVAVENIAYTWFGRPNVARSGNKTFIGLTKDITGGTTQHVAEFNELTGVYTETQVGTAFEKDDHNQAQILVRASDSRLIAVYSEHNGAALRIRISTNPNDSTAWGAEATPVSTGISYATIYQATNGNIFVFYRKDEGGGKNWYYIKSTNDGVAWGTPIKIMDGLARQAYLVTEPSDTNSNIIHFCMTDGHPMHFSTKGVVNIFHFYMDLSTEKLYKSDGTEIITLPIVPTDGTQVTFFTGNDTSWGLDIICKNGLPRMIYLKYPDGGANTFQFKDLYVVKWNGTTWDTPVYIARELDGYIYLEESCYSGASRFDKKDPDIIWGAIEVNNVIEIHKVNIADTGNIIIEQLTFNSSVNNWRPICSNGNVKNLMWLRANTYTTYTNYDMDLMSLSI